MADPFPLFSTDAIPEWIERHVPPADFRDRRVLLIVPDATRTAPLPALFEALWNRLRPVARDLDVLVALGTHPPLSESQICRLLGIREDERGRRFATLGLFNHEWDRPERLVQLGVLTREETAELSGGLLVEDVPVTIWAIGTPTRSTSSHS